MGDNGGSLRVELNHTSVDALPAGFRLGDNDTRILSVARNLANEGNDVTLVSKDLPMRVKASAVGLIAEEYRAELALESGQGDVVAHLLAQARSLELSVRDRGRAGGDPDPGVQRSDPPAGGAVRAPALRPLHPQGGAHPEGRGAAGPRIRDAVPLHPQGARHDEARRGRAQSGAL